MDNPNFKLVKLWNGVAITKETLLSLNKTKHWGERSERTDFAISLDNDSSVDQIFEADKGHLAGPELHVVTTNGMIYVLNKSKFLKGVNCLITILIARPGQVSRLYIDCGLTVSENILNKCRYYQKNGYNLK